MTTGGAGLAYPARPKELADDALRSVGIEADCDRSTSAAMERLLRLRAKGWMTRGTDGTRIGWTQRDTQHVGVLGFAIVGSVLGGRPISLDPDRDAQGWINVTVSPFDHGVGSRIEVRGEIDRAMDEALSTTLNVLATTVVRVWDPMADATEAATDPPPTA